jgi:hypothetical protein
MYQITSLRVQAVKPGQHPVGKFEVTKMMGGSIENFFEGLEARIGSPRHARTCNIERNGRGTEML